MRERNALLVAGIGVVALAAAMSRGSAPSPAGAPSASSVEPGFAPLLEGTRLDQFSPLHDMSHVAAIVSAMPTAITHDLQPASAQPIFGAW